MLAVSMLTLEDMPETEYKGVSDITSTLLFLHIPSLTLLNVLENIGNLGQFSLIINQEHFKTLK